MHRSVAIVIPAWKPDFLSKTLACFESQTSRDFALYVGDDASPHDLRAVVDAYSDRMTIEYVRFPGNLGGRDLVAHWERCIGLTRDEPLIWLFSDDDLADPQCVELLLEAWRSAPDADLFHFDLAVVGERDELLQEPPRFPARLGGLEFYRMRRDDRILSFAPEFVFTRRVHDATPFVPMDLAWGSDICTWVRYAGAAGMVGISGPRVRWRRSSLNISPNRRDHSILIRKIRSEIGQIVWIKDEFRRLGAEWTLRDEVRSAHAFCRNSIQHLPPSRWRDWFSLLSEAASTSPPHWRPLFPLLALASACKRRLRFLTRRG